MVDWITIDKNSGNSGTTVITVTASSYQELLERTTSLTVNTVNTSLSGSVAIIQQPREVETVMVSPTTISAPASGGVYTFNIISNGAWTIEYPEWVFLSQTAGTGNATITVEIPINYLLSGLTGNITVSTIDNSATVQVNQERNTGYINITPGRLFYAYSGGVQSVIINSNTDWTITNVPSWASFSKLSGSGDDTVFITITGTPSDDRDASVKFSVIDEDTYLTIHQSSIIPYLYFTNSAVTFSNRSGSTTNKVNSNVEWEIMDLSEPFTIEVVSAGTIQLSYYSGDLYVYYNDVLTTEHTFNVSSNDTLKIIYNMENQFADRPFTFSNNVKVNISGNLLSLKYKDYATRTELNSIGLEGLFSGITEIISAENLLLPATTLADNCYRDMFSGCTNLVNAPSILPATTLTDNCYQNMFYGCTSLVNAPELPATTLAYNCYASMFQGCTSLVNTPQLPATTVTTRCYENMFNGCINLVNTPSILPATTLANYCYQGMFSGCTSLTQAPQLPATTLANYCYQNMFYGCTNLVNAPSILPATTLTEECYREMFRGCTSLTTAPVLPATTLTVRCYQYMFSGCTNLNYIKCLATNISARNCVTYWVENVAPTGTFVKAATMNDWSRGISGIPNNWTEVDAS